MKMAVRKKNNKQHNVYSTICPLIPSGPSAVPRKTIPFNASPNEPYGGLRGLHRLKDILCKI